MDHYRNDAKIVRKFGEEPFCFDLFGTGMGDKSSSIKITHKSIGAAKGAW